MLKQRTIFLLLALLLFAIVVTCGAQTPASHDQPSALVLVFKDGHTKSFAVSEVSRIEFNPTRIVLKNGHQENFTESEITRIEMSSSSADNGVLGRNHFIGKWKVGDGIGGTFIITLNRDGEANKTRGASHGTWTVVDGEARINWDDGWHDAIRKAGNKHEKVAYEPGKTFDDKPSNVTDAERKNAQPI